eukprot:CAMPEP_0196755842 /NCGR_PEP_ID=MMETSP1091-20130531/98889_1 /TAXON_ID=302021 /ORGANISM="Rhodomonas sp., Strain CCMP768" /LENGTH=60 /DNA_ID=CAMNT_0042104345 /DNA_START=17 /DNA_END=199 /DNA_ORIENTATION=+
MEQARPCPGGVCVDPAAAAIKQSDIASTQSMLCTLCITGTTNAKGDPATRPTPKQRMPSL